MLTVGQKLYFVGAHRYNAGGKDVVVKKVGRKWATLQDGERIDLQTLHMDGGGYTSPGTCWLSRELYEAEMARVDAWDVLRMYMHRTMWRLPDNMTLEQIRQVADIIGAPQ
jgi:hypothetical protein